MFQYRRILIAPSDQLFFSEISTEKRNFSLKINILFNKIIKENLFSKTEQQIIVHKYDKSKKPKRS